MSQTRVQLVGNVSTGASFAGIVTTRDLNVIGVITATSFKTSDGDGAIVGINTVGVSTFSDIQVGGAVTIAGNLTVNGTQTIINTEILDVEDVNIGIASTATGPLSDAQLDGAGITIYGSAGNKTLTWDNSNSRMSFNTPLYATSYYGDGSNLDNVVSGITLKSDGTLVSAGAAATTINFSGATISDVSSGIATITIAAGGISTEASTGGLVTLDLTAQDHKVTATGITTITVSGGTEGDSHTVRIVNSGIATVGFSTYFLFPSGSTPVLPTASGSISLLSFTVHRVGAAGTQLLAGASLNFS